MRLLFSRKFSPVLAIFVALGATPAFAETYISIFSGGQFGTKGTNLRAQEDLNYTASPANKHPATGSDLKLDSSLVFGAKGGYYTSFVPGLGIEAEVQYSRPNFKQQNVAITLTDNTTIGGTNKFTENQLPAKFQMLSGGINLLYRFDQISPYFKPYIGAGPAVLGLFVKGTGDSCNIIAPATLVRGFCSGGTMTSHGKGFGYNAKAGVEVPINDDFSMDAEYKFSYGALGVNWFRSFSDVKVNYKTHNITVGLRYKY